MCSGNNYGRPIDRRTPPSIISVMIRRYVCRTARYLNLLKDLCARNTVGMAEAMVRVGILSRYRTIGRNSCAALMLASTCLLASCNSATLGTTQTADGAQLDVIDKVKSLDLLPRQPQPVNSAGVPLSSG